MSPDNDMPMLAGRAGSYREFRPAPALRRHFLCAWSNAFPPGGCGLVAVVPDGCIDIVWLEGRLMVAGPDVTANIVRPAAGAVAVGLRFRPGAAATWLGLPMSELVGRRIGLAEMGNREALGLSDRIGEGETSAAKLRVLQAGLEASAGAINPPSADMEHVFSTLGGRAEAGSLLPKILDDLAVSPRSLRRRCHAAFGYGPKTLERILRFQRFLQLARGRGSALAALALEAGYADQAHLAREVRRLAGLTPSAVVGQAGAA